MPDKTPLACGSRYPDINDDEGSVGPLGLEER